MSRINDEEDLLKSLQVYVMANLNDKILAINTEKNDSYDIEQFSEDDDYFVIAGELEDMPNHAFVNFGIDGEIDVLTNGDDSASLPTIRIEVVFDNPHKPGTYYKSLRYMRAITETVLEYASSTFEVGDLKVTKAIPMAVTVDGRRLIVSGVSLSVALG